MLVLVLVSLVGKKNCFSSLCWSSVTKEIESTIFQRIKIDQTNTNDLWNVSWWLQVPWEQFLGNEETWVGNKNTQYLLYITRGVWAICSAADHIRPLVSSTSHLSETSQMEEFGDLKQNPLSDGPLWKISPICPHCGTSGDLRAEHHVVALASLMKKWVQL